MRLHSTRNLATTCSFRRALVANLADDGGLLVPELPVWQDWDALLALPWAERAPEILSRLLCGEFDDQVLRETARRALDLPIPLVHAGPDTFALELFHGPTLAFKDFGARLLAGLLALHDEGRGTRTILTATSGDTGAAVAHAFWRVPGIAVVILYPKGRVSAQQERQFASLGDNVVALAVDGAFDDCQTLAKACFADPILSSQAGLTSANSINIARILAQLCYYTEIVSALRQAGQRRLPLVSVPSGNFGNLCAGLYARQLGLPLAGLVAACNANTTVPDYLDGAAWRPRASIATLSNAMDVGAPSNWERIDHLLGGRSGAVQALRWGHVDDAATRRELRRLHDSGWDGDPHAAVASAVLQQVRRPGELGVFLATAHPAKFAEQVQEATGVAVPLPDALTQLADRPLQNQDCPNDLEAVRAVLSQLR